jgi:TrmH family RNA methyltransferase
MPQVRPAPGRVRDIESASNPLLKIFRKSLAEGVTRDGLLALEGPHLVEEALNAAERATVHTVLVARGAEARHEPLLRRLSREAEAARVSDRIFASVAQTETPQGIAALVELKRDELEAALAPADAVVLVACGIQDPGNLGTMVRSAQALGAAALIALEETVSPFNPKAARASAGAIFRLPVFPGAKARDMLPRLRSQGVKLIAADQRSPASLADADLRAKVAFLIGREAAGVPEELRREADLLLRIPIRRETESLNAAAAASIFLYEGARQRGFAY